MKNLDFPHVSIILINWNGWKDTIECLESLYQIDYANYDVIVVDNASSDNSVKKIKDYCLGKINIKSKFFKYDISNKPIHILEYSKVDIENNRFSKDEKSFLNFASNRKLILILNDKNYMFVDGNNIPIKYFVLKRLKTKYILLLNNDTVVEKYFLNELIKVIEKDIKIGIIGPKICLYNDPDKREWNWLQKIKEFPVECEYLSGAALLFKLELINTIGLLDSRYIHYFEEIDYCFSARKAGYKVIYLPTNNKVLHKGAASMKKVGGLEIYYRARNYLIFMRKHLNTINFLKFSFHYLSKQIFIEFKKYPKKKIFVLKGVLNGIFLILKDKSLLIKK